MTKFKSQTCDLFAFETHYIFGDQFSVATYPSSYVEIALRRLISVDQSIVQLLHRRQIIVIDRIHRFNGNEKKRTVCVQANVYYWI